MANNRMYLVFMPTKDAVYLGKRMGWGWYGSPPDLSSHMQELYDIAEQTDANQDDFKVVFEDQDVQLTNEINVLNLNRPTKDNMSNDTIERIKDYTLAIVIGVALATILFFGLSS